MCERCQDSVLAGIWAEEKQRIGEWARGDEERALRRKLTKAEQKLARALHDLRMAHLRDQTATTEAKARLIRAHLAQLQTTPRWQLPPRRT